MEALERYFWRDRVEFADRLNISNDREATVIALTRYVAGCFPDSRIEHLAPVPQDPTNHRPDLSRARSRAAR